MSRSIIAVAFSIVWLWTGLALGQAKPGARIVKRTEKAFTHGANGSTTDIKFKTARQAAVYTAARQLEEVMVTGQMHSERLTARLTPPVSAFRLHDAGISSTRGRAARHQVVTRALGHNGEPLAKVRVSVLRLKDGTYKAWDNGAYHRVRVNVGGTYIPMRDYVGPNQVVRAPVVKRSAPPHLFGTAQGSPR